MSNGELVNNQDYVLQELYGTVEQLCMSADRRARALASLGPEPEGIDLISRMNFQSHVTLARDLSTVITAPDSQTIEAIATKRSERIVRDASQHAIEDGGGSEGIAFQTAAYAMREAFLVDRFRHYKYGVKHPTTTVRAYNERMVTNTAFATANLLYGHKDRAAILRSLLLGQELSINHQMEIHAHAGSKINQFAVEVRNAFSLFDILLEQDQPQDELSGEVENLKEIGDSLWEEQKLLRRFGLKPAIAPSNLPAIKNIVMRPGREIIELLKEGKQKLTVKKGQTSDPEPTKHTIAGAVASVELSDLPLKRQLPPTSVIANMLSMSLNDMLDATPEELAGVNIEHPFLRLQLRNDGELYSYSGVPIRRVAADLEAEQAYDQLRLEVLALHYDLVVPVYVQKLIKDQIGRGEPPETNIERVREMCIARRRYLRERKTEIIEKLEEEKKEFANRPIGSRPVTGHVRDLPPEFSASAEARKMALLEDDRVLADFGETWVKYHDRPGGGQAVGEAVKVRPTSGKYKNRQRTRTHRR